MIGELIGAGAGLINGIGSAISASKNNQTQKYLTRLNMDFQREMAQKQMDYNSQMYEKQLQDYSPAAIRQRLDDAGLNSGLIMSGGAGVASSAGNSPSAGLQSGGVSFHPENVGAALGNGVDAFARILSTITQSQNLASDTKLKSAQAKNQDIQNAYAERQIISNLAWLASNTKNVKLRNNFQRMQNQVMSQTMQQQIARYQIENDNLKAQMQVANAQSAFTAVQTDLAQKQLDWFDRNQIANLTMIAANVDLTRAQKVAALTEATLKAAQAKGQQISNRVAEKTAWTVIKTMEANRSFAEWQAVTQKNNSKANSAYQVSPWLGAGLDVLHGVTGLVGAARGFGGAGSGPVGPTINVPRWY